MFHYMYKVIYIQLDWTKIERLSEHFKFWYLHCVIIYDNRLKERKLLSACRNICQMLQFAVVL